MHPLRAKILEALAGSTKSPVQLAGELDARLGSVSYHVRTLERDGLIELTRTRPVRGTIEHFYTGRARLCECCGGRGVTEPD
jgi:DNA-binding MarR family transcriptional regulator